MIRNIMREDLRFHQRRKQPGHFLCSKLMKLSNASMSLGFLSAKTSCMIPRITRNLVGE